MNRDGFVNKKEFQWMTTNTILSQKKIDTMFKVVLTLKQVFQTNSMLITFLYRDVILTVMEN